MTVRQWRCPDCNAELVIRSGQVLQHDPDCPTGAANDAMMTDDRAWFDANPEADMRVRPIRPSEVVELNWCAGLPTSTKWVGQMIVLRGPVDGVRWRSFVRCFPLSTGVGL